MKKFTDYAHLRDLQINEAPVLTNPNQDPARPWWDKNQGVRRNIANIWNRFNHGEEINWDAYDQANAARTAQNQDALKKGFGNDPAQKQRKYNLFFQDISKQLDRLAGSPVVASMTQDVIQSLQRISHALTFGSELTAFDLDRILVAVHQTPNIKPEAKQHYFSDHMRLLKIILQVFGNNNQYWFDPTPGNNRNPDSQSMQHRYPPGFSVSNADVDQMARKFKTSPYNSLNPANKPAAQPTADLWGTVEQQLALIPPAMRQNLGARYVRQIADTILSQMKAKGMQTPPVDAFELRQKTVELARKYNSSSQQQPQSNSTQQNPQNQPPQQP